jgi:hypothetical protein
MVPALDMKQTFQALLVNMALPAGLYDPETEVLCLAVDPAAYNATLHRDYVLQISNMAAPQNETGSVPFPALLRASRTISDLNRDSRVKALIGARTRGFDGTKVYGLELLLRDEKTQRHNRDKLVVCRVQKRA